MNTKNFVLNGLLVESLLNLAPGQLSILAQALELAQERLNVFANDPAFSAKMALAFGSTGNAAALQAAWLAGDFSILSGIEVLGAEEINEANGAYAVSTDRIYLSLAFLERHLSDPEGLVSVLLEEAGHRIDARLNEKDSPGDEGAIFSALVRGEMLTESQLGALKAEDDTATVQLNGQSVQIEQAAATSSNPFYKYDIIANVGDLGITDFENQPSINDIGTVAFIGYRGSVTDVFAGNGLAPLIDVTGSSAVASNSTRFVQINNNNKIVTNDFRINASGSAISAVRVRDANNPGSFQNTVTTSGSIFDSFDAVLAAPSINNNNDVVFTGLVGANRFLATKAFVGFNTSPIRSGAPRPIIADNGTIVFQEKFGTDTFIEIANKDFSQFDEIAGPSKGFTNLGSSPGISDDGNIVTFYGELSAARTTALNPNPGKGIFTAIKTTSGWQTQRIAGISGNGFLDPGETFKDNNNDGKFNTGDIDVGTFSDFDPNTRVAVNSTQNTQRAVTIAYIANDNSGNKGVYTNRLNFFGDGTSAFDPFASTNQFSVSRPTLVIENGDSIAGIGTVQDVNIYDPLNNRDRGDVAAWVSTTSGEAVVRARPQEVIYLDFDTNSITNLEAGAKAIFQDLGAPLSWGAGISSAFTELSVNRPDLIGATNLADIRAKVVQQVQQKFDDIKVNVKVIDGAPSDIGSGTQVYIGNGPTFLDNTGKIKRLNGIASSVDLFNRDFHYLSTGKVIPLTQNDTAFVFLDNLLAGNGLFTQENVLNVSGTPIDLNYTGSNQVTKQEVINAISDTVAHEVGHTLGLAHLDTNLSAFALNATTGPNEKRYQQKYGTLPLALDKVPGIARNDQQRLAFTVGSDDDSIDRRNQPTPEELNALFNQSRFDLSASLGGSSINVVQAAIGIIPEGEFDALPNLIDLGSGNLSSLLNTEIEVGENDQIFIVASTDGNGIDIVGVVEGFESEIQLIDLSNGLAVLADERIRGNVFNDSGQPLASALKLFQKTQTGFVQIGTVGSGNTSGNTPPIVINDTATTNEDTPININVLANDSDPDGDPLTLSLATPPTNGTITLNDNGTPTTPSDDFITYTPNFNFNGSDSFTYIASDGKGGSATAEVTVTVNSINDVPSVSVPIADQTTIANVAYNFAIPTNTFIDIDTGDTLSYLAALANGSALPAWLNFDPLTATFSGTPLSGDVDTLNIQVIATDLANASVADTFDLIISNINNAPTGSATAVLPVGTEDTDYIVTKAQLLEGFSDIDGDSLSIINFSSSNGTITTNPDESFTLTPTPNYNGSVTLTYQVSDGTNTIDAALGFTLSAVNDAPTGTPSASLPAGTEDTVYIVNVADLLIGLSDVDGDTLTISGLTATNGTLGDNGNGTYDFIPNANYNGPVTLNYNVIDGNGGSITATQSFTLAAVNDAPVLTGTLDTLAVGTEDTGYTITVANLLTGFTDVDGDTLSVSGLSATNGSLTNNSNGTYTFTPNANYNGTVTLSYSVIDGNGGSVAATQTFSLAAVNDAPTLSNISKTGAANTVISFTATDFTSVFSDIDGDSLTKIQITFLPTNGTLNLNGVPVSLNQEIAASALGTLTFTPTANFNGPISFGWNGFDGTTYAVTGASVNLTINSGSNPIQGTPGPDILMGTDGVDIIDGKAGNDTLTGNKGDDTLIGGGGRDTFIFNLGDGTDTITDFGGVGTGNYPTPAIIAQVDTLQFQGAGLTARNLQLTQNGSNLEVTFEGISGNKVILQNFDLQNIDNLSKDGAKVIGNIRFDGQTSLTDSYDVFDANSTQTKLSRRNTITFLNDLNNTVNGFDKSDDVINGQGGDDTINGKGGNDLLRGGAGNDKLFGGTGNDILRGGTGFDILTGGNGNDTFILASGDGTDK